jgi:hypothetical protein
LASKEFLLNPRSVVKLRCLLYNSIVAEMLDDLLTSSDCTRLLSSSTACSME